MRKGARLYAIDPRRTSSAAWADVWLGLDVGSDIALANAIGREIIAADLCNREFIARATTGFDAYRRSVEPYTLDHAAGITGIPADTIRELAHAYARAKSFGLFSCSKATNEVNYLAQKFARGVIGSHNVDSCNRT